MSICPDKDIHSIYLDGELPEQFKSEYEAHVASCPKCAAELNKLRKIHEFLQQDSKAIEPDKKFLDESYKRLESRMRFANIVSISQEKKPSYIKYFVPAAAAAAAVFALMLPLQNARLARISRTAQAGYSQSPEALQVVSRKEITPVSQQGVIVDGNINSFALDTHSEQVHSATNAGLSSKYLYSSLASVDVFLPNFSEQNVKISLPDISNVNNLLDTVQNNSMQPTDLDFLN